MKFTLNEKSLKAFSLVEMLVVIAVIGIISGIAIPNISRINESAVDAKDRRNAQNIASLYSTALVAGYDFRGPGRTADLENTVINIVTGVTISEEGPFKDAYFGVPNLSAGEQDGAIRYLNIEPESQDVVYDG